MHWKDLERRTKQKLDEGTKNVTYSSKRSVAHFTIQFHCLIQFLMSILIIATVYCFQFRYIFYDLCLNACLVISDLFSESISQLRFTVLFGLFQYVWGYFIGKSWKEGLSRIRGHEKCYIFPKKICNSFHNSGSLFYPISQWAFWSLQECIISWLMFECLSSYFWFISLVHFTNQFHCFIWFLDESFDDCKNF